MKPELLSTLDFKYGNDGNFRTISNVLMIIYLCRKDTEDREIVLSSEANSAIPEMVIKFYESRVTWRY